MLSTFNGYFREDGRVGTRNHLLVLPLYPACNRVAAMIATEFPTVAVVEMHQDWAPDLEGWRLAVRTLAGWTDHPNVYATLLIGVEPHDALIPAVTEQLPKHVRYEVVTLSESHGTRRALDAAKRLLIGWIREREGLVRQPAPLGQLILGTECGGSDACSGLSANPTLGRVSDRLIAMGGRSILAETTELIGAEHLLAKRAASPAIAAQLLATVTHAETSSMRMGVDFRGAQPAPGNIEGGISTIEEKSLGCVHKGGNSPLQAVVDYAERPVKPGLTVMDTPGHDVMQLVGMAAGGAQVIVFTTGRGTPTGSAIVPVIKMSTRTALKQSLDDVIDIDAGPIIEGVLSVDQVADQLLRKIVSVANGEPVAAERGHHHEFGIFPGWDGKEVAQ
ncbi:MAG: UxaA family hydrolase [Firmicutes bacterium]|jgi:altronate dehydratase large subunit|nr:UxaA family hydrolase [Bacillota bacterium]